ncbi:OmpA family protein [Parerythrobacter jejuensis]|uniref:OmpA family protein n=1 Tax=Parerythrobacter jejuensis TaxID=795812 RepID=A0A845AVG5_9SPHN|nr:OmpA family protein [Parerythrobacter jejuensis]MXP30818.1 OmpA family protein [Parerythrobacter jejuensis]MXP33578.1 OmpA family protein [Parerythrobacter jejuensis]
MRSVLILGLSSLALLACGDTTDADPTVVDDVEASPSTTEPVSIIRPDIEEARMVPLEPLALTISFGKSGDELDDTAVALLEDMLASRQFEAGGAITIGGHSDAGGDDAVNQRMSQSRADAVKAWLVGQDVPEDRITTIAFGEQNPVAPNALPDGEPNEPGRIANRRVEIRIAVPEGMMVEAEPKSLTDAVSADDQDVGEATPES